MTARPVAEQPMILRAFAVDAVDVTGRTVVLRCVPYDTVQVVRDRLPDGTWTPPYREGWRRGAFRRIVAAAHRVPLVVGDHARRADPSCDVGRGVEFAEQPDGLIGSFVVDASPFGEHALQKVTTGQWRGASIGARPLRHVDDGDLTRGGTRWRTLAALDHVLLTETPAYADAGVLAVRAADADAPLLAHWRDKYPATAR